MEIEPKVTGQRIAPPKVIVRASEPEECVKCFELQREAHPNVEPSCGLQERMDAINARTARAGLEFGRADAWAEENNCPAVKIELLGQPVFGVIHPGQRFTHRGATPPTESIIAYKSLVKQNLRGYYRQRRNSGRR